ncbi:MAG: hypothetical protein ACXVG9_12130 [Terriglobales bacterium]
MSSAIFGRAKNTEKRGLIMPCTVISRLAAVSLLAISASAAASGSDQPPRFLNVPVLGLRLPLDRLNVDKLPEDIRATCSQIADDELYTGQVWVFGKVKDAAATYYILTGIFKRRSPDPERERRLYERWDTGAVFTVKADKCGGDEAVETFEVHDPNAEMNGNVRDPILRELARDLAARTVRAFGGPDRLRAEIKNQRIDFNRLPSDLQEAFKPYFGTAK